MKLTEYLASALGNVPVFDGLAPADAPDGPRISIYELDTMQDRKLEGWATDRRIEYMIVCSNHDAAGATILAREVTDLLDGEPIGRDIARVAFTTNPLRSNDDPQHPTYSVTVTASIIQARTNK